MRESGGTLDGGRPRGLAPRLLRARATAAIPRSGERESLILRRAALNYGGNVHTAPRQIKCLVAGFSEARLRVRQVVMRRYTAILVVWASLLGGLLPTVACAFDLCSNCCPAEFSHFSQGARPNAAPVSSVEACCALAPAQPVMVSAADGPGRHDLRHVPPPSDPGALAPSMLISRAPDRSCGTLAPSVLAYRENASLTYLHTARLRL